MKLYSELNCVLSKHVGRDLSAVVLKQISIDMEKVLNGYIFENKIDTAEFPYKFENNLGSWEIHSDGKVFFAPRKAVQYIEHEITIKKTEQ